MAKSDDNRDGRSDVARGYVLASRATSIGMQMALPPLAGWWLDGKFHTEPWCVTIGAALGFSVSMLEIMRLAKENDKTKR